MIVCHTTYYARLRHLDVDKYAFISISRKIPPNTPCVLYDALAPSATLLQAYKHNIYSQVAFSKRYVRTLSRKLTCKCVIDAIVDMAGNKIPVLVCWEGRDKFCHRHLVIKWLQRSYPELVSNEL